MTRLQASFAVLSVGVLLALVVHPIVASSAQNSTPAAPTNIQLGEVLTPVFHEILAASPSFAAQCARISEARHVRVIVTPVMASSTMSRGTARTTMRRFASGLLLAEVEMPVPLTALEYAELFGHEFEHIIEQIDRVNLEALRIAREGATRLSDGAYETKRARKAGLLIAGETERPRAAPIAAPAAQPAVAIAPDAVLAPAAAIRQS